MLISTKVLIKVNHKNKNLLANKGYTFEIGNMIEIKVDDLSKSSREIVKVKCDYCEREIEKQYLKYLKGRLIVDKDCCDSKECKIKKFEDVNLKKYGVKYPTQRKEVIEKREENNLIKYGVKNYTQTEEFLERFKNTNIEKYGVEFPTQNKEIIEKSKTTNLEKYGVENFSKTNEFKEKFKNTCLEKYGVENPFQVEEIKRKSKDTMFNKFGYEYNSQVPEIKSSIRKNMNKTMYLNGNAPTSRQQILIHKLIGGEINYPIDHLSLDIAFPDEKIYIEYQGSGHDLDVQMGRITEKEQFEKDLKRFYFLKNRGWKMIEIISSSKYDYLPSDEKIIEMINYAKEILIKQNKSFLSFNINKGIIRTSEKELIYDFGDLRKTIKRELIKLK